MDILNFFVELSKSISWPIVVLVSVCLLKDKIYQLLPKIDSAKFGNAEIKFVNQDSIPSSNPINNTKIESLNPTPDTTGIRGKLEDIIKNQLKKITDDSKKIDILIQNYAHTNLLLYYERIYYIIFGSQIKLLEKLNSTNMLEISDVLLIYKDAAHKFPEIYSKYHFDSYIKYLKDNGLISVNSKNIHIEELGKSFLLWLTETGHPKDKLG